MQPFAELAMARPRVLPTVARAGAVVALGGFALVFGLGASQGGYFPTSWGWATLALCWAATVALVVQPELRWGRLELGVVASLTAFALWTGLSTAWTQSTSRSVLEAERALLYVVGLIAVFAIVRRTTVGHLLAGVLAAIVVLCSYALATRLFPERLGSFDPVSSYRLAAPVGYWNALGIVTAMGIVLAAGAATRGRTVAARALAAAAVVLLCSTLFFTYSRGAWIALFVGLATLVAFGRQRLQVLTTILLIAFPAALAVWLSSRPPALTHTESRLTEASAQGHRLAVFLLALAVLAGAISLALALAQRHVDVPGRLRRAYACGLIAALVVAVGAAFVRYGSPVAIATSAYTDFTSSSGPLRGTDLNTRLFSLSGNGRAQLWEAAWDDWRDHRRLGSGAGTYEQYWARNRPFSIQVRDAHSLYAEVLAELGPVGLGLLVVALALPFLAARRARSEPLGAAALGAYVAFAIHAAIDWDWEMPVVAMTGLICGGALLIAARRDGARPAGTPLRVGAVALVLAASAATLVAVVGNSALAAGASAARAQEWVDSEAHARKAMRWMPWSSDPWQMVGEAQLAQHRTAQARVSFRKAISKDARDWELWVDLALANPQPARRRAALVALRLNPLSPEIAQSRPLLGLGP
jgi:hypothetical protein